MSYEDPYANQSSEKVINTQRERPGRSNVYPTGPPPRSTGILRMWRKDERGRQWTRGGGFRSSLRMICCCATLTILIVISVVLAILLFIRPPRVVLNEVLLGSSPVSLTSSGLTVSFNIEISVSNPNWFNVDFSQITATARYPGVSGDLGGGTLRNVNFKGHTDSTFDFPFSFNYTTAADPNGIILSDLRNKCGSNPQDITIDYDLDMRLKILGVTFDPKLDSSASFTCPISSDDINQIIGD